jgi:EmrB/QacA subfamily drug resistance transporter
LPISRIDPTSPEEPVALIPTAPLEETTPPRKARLTVTEDNRRWWTLGAMCFALFMVMLDNTVVNVALPSIQRDLGASISGLEWTVNAYTLSFAVLLVTGGRLGDLFGRRRMFLFGVITFAVSSAFIGLSQSEAWLVSGRAVQGIGAAFMMPATLSIISNAFPPHERGKAIGTWAGVSAMALAIGPVVGGFMVEHISWQSIFFLNLPVAALAVAVTLFATHESRDETVPPSVDVAGVVTITVGLAALVLALVQANSWGWGSTEIVGLLVLSVAGLAGFVYAETRVRAPMVDFSFFRSRSFLGANIVAFIVSFAMLAMFFFLALYMQNIKGYTPLQAGIRFLPSTVVIIFAGPIAGRLTDRIGARPLISTGLLLVSGSLFWQGHLAVDTPYSALLGAFVMMGVGMGLVMSPMSTAAMNAVEATKAGVASGILSMSRMVGGTFGVAAMGALVTGLGRRRIEDTLPQLPAAARDRITEGLGAGAAQQVPGPVADAVREAFVYALNNGLRLGAAFAALGALLAWALIAPRVSAPAPAAEVVAPELAAP